MTIILTYLSPYLLHNIIIFIIIQNFVYTSSAFNDAISHRILWKF